jgi:hypothetical protein
MSLLHAVRLLESLGLQSVTITPAEDAYAPPGHEYRDAAVSVTPPTRLYPGAVSKLRSRVWFAVLDHKRHHGETGLDGSYTLARVVTGSDTAAWHVVHDGCRLNALRRAS